MSNPTIEDEPQSAAIDAPNTYIVKAWLKIGVKAVNEQHARLIALQRFNSHTFAADDLTVWKPL